MRHTLLNNKLNILIQGRKDKYYYFETISQFFEMYLRETAVM